MSLLEAPAWLQVALGLNALAIAGSVARFGWRGLAVSAAGTAACWFLLAFGGSWLVGRLEGGSPGSLVDLLPGAGLALQRLAAMAGPLLLLSAAAGGLLHLRRRRRAATP